MPNHSWAPGLLVLAVLAGGTSRPHDGRWSHEALLRTDTVEAGRFILFKLQQRVGEERYAILRDGDSLVVRAEASLSFLGAGAPLAATLVVNADGTPRRYGVTGATSTMTSIDQAIAIQGGIASVRDGHAVQSRAMDPSAFTLSHYAPVTMRMTAVRFWLARGTPSVVPLLPEGALKPVLMGRDTVAVAGRPTILDRYGVEGLGWGLQSVWLDADQRLIALVGGDAELDRFEAVRDGYEAGIGLFVRRAVEDGLEKARAQAATLRPIHQGMFAIAGVRLVDVIGAAPIADATIVVEDGRIREVGPSGRVRVPTGVPVFPGRGLTALPGLWDMHGHYEQVEWPLVGLAAGVTTVRDVGNEFELVTALRDGVAAGRILGPRMLLAGVVDGGEHPLGVVTANSPEEAHAVVRRYHAAGFRQIKVYQSLPPALVPTVAEEAHRLGMTVTGHVPTGMNAFEFVRAGADQINHLNFVTAVMRPAPQAGQPPQPVDLESAVAREAVRFLVEHRVVVDPSLARAEEFLHPRGRYAESEPGIAQVPVELRGPLNSTGIDPARADRARAALDRSLAIVGALHRAGVPIVLGTDLTVPGHSIYRELELAVRAGLTPLDALRAATLVPARVMGLEHESGALVAGMRADVILVAGDPLARIEDIRRNRYVVAGGRLFETAALWRAAGFAP